MSQQQAEAFIARVQEDPEFADRLAALKDDPAAAQALVAAEGFDATPDEVREAFLEAFGAELSEEQLAAIAGGVIYEPGNEVIGAQMFPPTVLTAASAI